MLNCRKRVSVYPCEPDSERRFTPSAAKDPGAGELASRGVHARSGGDRGASQAGIGRKAVALAMVHRGCPHVEEEAVLIGRLDPQRAENIAVLLSVLNLWADGARGRAVPHAVPRQARARR